MSKRGGGEELIEVDLFAGKTACLFFAQSSTPLTLP